MDGTDDSSFDDRLSDVDIPPAGDIAAESARFFQDRAREAIGQKPFTSREPCRNCGSTDALLETKNGQATVRCRKCHRHIYNAPKDETGERPRTVETLRRDIKPSQQQRVFQRDGMTCVLCHRSEVPLTVGHVLSLKDALRLNESGPYLRADENLVTMCEACNLGLGGASLLPVTYARVVLKLLQAASEAKTLAGNSGTQAQIVDSVESRIPPTSRTR